MRIIVKIGLTIVTFLVSLPILALAREVPFLKLILIAGLIAGITAIWKYNPDKKSESIDVSKTDGEDKHQLDKT